MGSIEVKRRKLVLERNDEVDETLNDSETTGQASQAVRSVHSKKHDVFISHRGSDTKKTFVAHLREALFNAGFSPFLDAKAIEPGGHVLQSIDEALNDAWAYVVVFSKGFAESKYCLYELCQMLELENKLILPVFYDVQPEHLRFTDSGPFAEGFQKHRRRGKPDADIDKWKNALREVADRRGFRLDEVSGDEQQLVRSIVVAVRNQMPVNLQGEKRLFGVEESMREILEEVDAMGDNVGILGLYGMGGIGKTTLADELYRHLLARGGWKASFLTDVRSKAPQELQRQVVHDLIQEKEMTRNCHIYRQWFNRIRSQRVLIVVDDIDNVNQFTNLVLDFELHPGSRIVVTSRHRDVLNRSMGLAHRRFLHEVKVLNSMYSRQIFNWHAFLSEAPTTEEFRDLAEKVADACGGHPLALEVIGASLFDKKDPETDTSLWMDAIKTLTENNDVLDKFKLSYYSLPSDGDKAMFRDIACLLIGMREEVALEIWKSCHSCSDYCSTTKGPGLVLRRLVDKSLVKIRDGVLSMHDLIRDMGRDIVMKEVPRERPGERTHLWNAATAAKVLRRNQGTDRVRGLTLSPIESNLSTVTFAAAQFASLHELHLLILDGCIVEGDDFLSWSEELRWLQWRWSPCTELPFHLTLPKLTVLDLTDSVNLSCLWKEDAPVEFPWLQRLIVKNCRSIAALPQNIGYKLPRLRILDLEMCSLLRTLPYSIGRLKNLERLNLSSCNHLTTLPESIGQLKNLEQLLLYMCTELETLPDAIVNLKKLKKLVLRGCVKIPRLPLELGSLMNLEEFDLARLESLHELPSSMSRLRKLKEVHMDSTGLLSLPNSFGQFVMNLRTLSLQFCRIEMLPQSFEGLKTLVFLDLGNSNVMGRLPSYFGAFTALKTLNLTEVRELIAIDALPQSLQHLDLYRCWKLMHLPSLAGMIHLKCFNMFECKSLLGVEGVEFLTTLEEINLAGCVSMVSSNLQIVQNTSALRSCRLSGSKIGVSYNNTWFEREPALQVISYYGNVMGFPVDNIVRKTLQIEMGSKALVMDSTILSNGKCVGVIICIVMRTQGRRENFGCDLEARVTRDNVEIMYASELCQVEYLDNENRVYLITLRRQHPLVQSLKFGDKICVYIQNTVIYPVWQGIVEERAICAIHEENDEQCISINSKLLNKVESKELSTDLGKLILADHLCSSQDDSLQYLNTPRTESLEPRNSKVCEQQGVWTMPPRYGEFMPHQCDSWRLPRAGTGVISFTAEGGPGVSVEIADPNGQDRYQILIRSFSTCIRRFSPPGFMADVSNVEKQFLHRKLPNQLWVSVDERTSIIQVGQGEVPGQDIISHYMDPEFFAQVQRVSFTTQDVPITYSNISFMDHVDEHMSCRLPDELHFEAVMDDDWTIVCLGGQYSWARYWKLPSRGRGVLWFRTSSVPAYYKIAISACPSTMDPMYEITIQVDDDEESAVIRRSTGGHISCQVSRCPEISGANSRWVSIDEETMTIQIGAGDACQANMFCSWKDPDFLSESLYFSFTTNICTITFSNISVAALP